MRASYDLKKDIWVDFVAAFEKKLISYLREILQLSIRKENIRVFVTKLLLKWNSVLIFSFNEFSKFYRFKYF